MVGFVAPRALEVIPLHRLPLRGVCINTCFCCGCQGHLQRLSHRVLAVANTLLFDRNKTTKLKCCAGLPASSGLQFKGGADVFGKVHIAAFQGRRLLKGLLCFAVAGSWEGNSSISRQTCIVWCLKVRSVKWPVPVLKKARSCAQVAAMLLLALRGPSQDFTPAVCSRATQSLHMQQPGHHVL